MVLPSSPAFPPSAAPSSSAYRVGSAASRSVPIAASSEAGPEQALSDLEFKLRSLLPADLYAAAWLNPSSESLVPAFRHLKTLHHHLRGYVPREVSHTLPQPGEIRHGWQTGTLLFTDLAGFTSLLEQVATQGQPGVETLLQLLNRYFAAMIEIISKSGGSLLEFTGDALLAQFVSSQDKRQDKRRGKYQSDVERAINAGLRMQRAMQEFAALETPEGNLSFGMRVGIHTGQFLTADIGTPLRMEHVLLGRTVLAAKQAETLGMVGRVCVTQATRDRLQSSFRFEAHHADHWLVTDDLAEETLGEYDITLNRRRLATPLLFDHSVSSLMQEIDATVELTAPLASYVPSPILKILVENAAQRKIPPAFPTAAVLFVNLIGLSEAVDGAQPAAVNAIVTRFSQLFAEINAVVENHGGILQKVTYHAIGSDILIHFGSLSSQPDAALRAASAALQIRDLVGQGHAQPSDIEPETDASTNSTNLALACRMGLTYGSVFATEIGEPRGRREFNILGDPVNTAARLMRRAAVNQILMDQSAHSQLQSQPEAEFDAEALGAIALKGKTKPTQIFAL